MNILSPMIPNQARKRVGFKADTDELPNDGDPILDEQGAVDPQCNL